MAMEYPSGTSDVKEPKDKERSAAVRERQRVIGRELRRLYDEVVQEPVPDDFLAILREIDETKDDKS
jgi:hypothetical protein